MELINNKMTRILYIAHFYKGSTSYERVNDLKKDFEVECLNINLFFKLWKRNISSIWRRLNFGPPFIKLYNLLIKTLESNSYEFIIIEKNIFFNNSKLSFIKKKYKTKLIMFCHDSIEIKDNISRIFINSLFLFDAVITTKNYDIDLYKKYGANKIYLVKDAISSHNLIKSLKNNNYSYDYKYDVGFIGRWEPARENLLKRLALDLDIKFILVGPGWVKRKSIFPRNVSIHEAVWGEEYKNLIPNIKINLGLFSEKAKDTFTTRLVEIPIFNGFMLTNFNADTNNIFSKNGCAEILYKNYDDLKIKINSFINNEKQRINLIKKMKDSIYLSGLTWENQINSLINDIEFN